MKITSIIIQKTKNYIVPSVYSLKMEVNKYRISSPSKDVFQKFYKMFKIW